MKFSSTGALYRTLPYEEHAVRVVLAVLVLAVVGYLALVSMSVVNVIAQKEAADRATAIRSDVGALEREYFALSQEITVAEGEVLGLTPITATNYVQRPGALGSAQGTAPGL